MKFKVFLSVLFMIQINSSLQYNGDNLRCLVCKSSLQELNKVVVKIDPSKKVDVGGYRLDSKGNYQAKSVSQAKSELHLSEVIEDICTKMDDYVRATWKNTGELMLLRLITDDGQMNTHMTEVDLIQDDDLNKSLKYLCEGIMSEFEDEIIKAIQNDSHNLDVDVCVTGTNVCVPTVPGPPVSSEPDVRQNTEL